MFTEPWLALSCLTPPKTPRFSSFCTTASRLILASSVFADIASTESSWMASSEWHAGQNPQIKKSSQGSFVHAALSIVYIHRQQRHKSSPAHRTMSFNTHLWIVWTSQKQSGEEKKKKKKKRAMMWFSTYFSG